MSILQTLLIVIFAISTISSAVININDVFSEDNRTQTCFPSQFLCNSGECIDVIFARNGVKDCSDGSDETCTCQNIKCSANFFVCKSGSCTHKGFVCDGVEDCLDGSDEAPSLCQCSENEFRCGSGGPCIKNEFLCDGKADCGDKTDESKKACQNNVCPDYAYTCRYGACVNGSALCDGIVDCLDGSDEDNTVCEKIHQNN